MFKNRFVIFDKKLRFSKIFQRFISFLDNIIDKLYHEKLSISKIIPIAPFSGRVITLRK